MLARIVPNKTAGYDGISPKVLNKYAAIKCIQSTGLLKRKYYVQVSFLINGKYTKISIFMKGDKSIVADFFFLLANFFALHSR